ncbi:hypothetical protein [Spirillospora sp. NPDC047279]|uniref:hypothetical protein n=1 Tax=Spirillospora sp. NPDC047279 TaxID=3155478 RepID=UPI00340AB0FA
MTCYAHDAGNGTEVGRVTARYWTSPSKETRGLTNRYFLVCIRSTDRDSGGGGRIEN